MRQISYRLAGILKAPFRFEVWFALFVYSSRLKGNNWSKSLSVDLTGLFLVFTVLCAFAIAYRRSWRFPARSFWCSMACIVFFAIPPASTLWTSAGSYAYTKAFTQAPLPLIAFILSSMILSTSKERIERFFKFVLAIGTLTLLTTYWAILTGTVSLASSLVLQHDEDYIGRGLVIAQSGILIYLALLFRRVNIVARLALTLVFLGFVFGVFLCGSKQALIALLLSTIVPIVMTSQHRAWKKHISVFASIIVLVLGITCYLGSKGITPVTLHRASQLFALEKGESVNDRTSKLHDAFQGFAERPFLGNGVAAYGALPNHAEDDYPHDIFAEIAFEYGVVGLLIFTFFIMRLIHRSVSLRTLFRDELMCGIMLSVLIYAISSLVSGTYATNRFLFTALGMLCYKPQTKVQSPKE
ncbi:MAG: O-antigen ligase family protein [Armatimonadota bacterium]|nr:O-antigen ligase family protein [bacterium]